MDDPVEAKGSHGVRREVVGGDEAARDARGPRVDVLDLRSLVTRSREKNEGRRAKRWTAGLCGCRGPGHATGRPQEPSAPWTWVSGATIAANRSRLSRRANARSAASRCRPPRVGAQRDDPATRRPLAAPPRSTGSHTPHKTGHSAPTASFLFQLFSSSLLRSREQRRRFFVVRLSSDLFPEARPLWQNRKEGGGVTKCLGRRGPPVAAGEDRGGVASRVISRSCGPQGGR